VNQATNSTVSNVCRNVADLSVEKRVALYTLLCEIAKSGDESARYLKQLGAEEVARIHNMPELAAAVSKV
jgi:hypothetical protein